MFCFGIWLPCILFLSLTSKPKLECRIPWLRSLNSTWSISRGWSFWSYLLSVILWMIFQSVFKKTVCNNKHQFLVVLFLIKLPLPPFTSFFCNNLILSRADKQIVTIKIRIQSYREDSRVAFVVIRKTAYHWRSHMINKLMLSDKVKQNKHLVCVRLQECNWCFL